MGDTRRGRFLAWAAATALAIGTWAAGPATAHGPPLTIVSWGGSYTASQMAAYVNPFRDTVERWVRVVDYDGGLDEITAQEAARNVTWDVVDLGLSDAIRGCEKDLLEPIDTAILSPAADGTSAAKDFMEGALRDCAVGQNVFSTVVGYDTARFANAPTSIADFFDLDAFPGKRGLRANPRVVLEWALMADGVAPAEVYDVLSTDSGIDRAFAMLESIHPQIVWWSDPATPPRLLADGEVAMTQTYNGRIQAAIDDGASQAILWDGQVRDIELWGIPKGSRNKEMALEFIAFATEAERMAEQSRHIAYGPARRSAMAMLPADAKARLPTAAANSQNAIWSDEAWWAANQDRMNARFAAWRRRAAAGEAPTAGTAR